MIKWGFSKQNFSQHKKDIDILEAKNSMSFWEFEHYLLEVERPEIIDKSEMIITFNNNNNSNWAYYYPVSGSSAPLYWYSSSANIDFSSNYYSQLTIST